MVVETQNEGLMDNMGAMGNEQMSAETTWESIPYVKTIVMTSGPMFIPISLAA